MKRLNELLGPSKYLIVLDLFLQNPEEFMNLREIARRIDKNPASIMKVLPSLVNRNYIARTKIGAKVVAIGTSLPELSTAIAASKEGHLKLGLGNILGACLTNLTLVLGFILILSPFSINMEVFTTLVFFVLVSNFLLWLFLGSFGRKKLERIEGIILLIVYVIFLILLLIRPTGIFGK